MSSSTKIDAPDFNDGAFRGIDRGGVADIAYFSLDGSSPVLDDLTFTRSAKAELEPEPEPVPTLGWQGIALLATLLAGFAHYRRRNVIT